VKKKRSTVKPYEGDKHYIFISYSHKDTRYVYPIIEFLAREGCRVWYDEGITPGSEWNEVIANHMNRSALCVAFISENAVASHNCRREISFALLKNKPLLSVFLEETVLSPGMELQLSANQCVSAHAYADMDKFMAVIMAVPTLKPCLGEPDPSIEVRSPSYYEIENGNESKSTSDMSDEWFSASDNQRIKREDEERKKREDEDRAKREAEERIKHEEEELAKREAEEHARREVDERKKRKAEEHAKRKAEELVKREAEERERRKVEERIQREKEERIRREVEERILREEEEARKAKEKVSYVLIRQSTGELISLDNGGLAVGREADNSMENYLLPTNFEISRRHFIISEGNGEYYIEDNKSKNLTFLNGTALAPKKPKKLSVGDTIRISTEYFTFQEKPSGSDRLP